ncbi:MFS transporter [Verticiella sediminum]|nr:MFS transporter [Verticiella sediminum]
MRKFYGWKIVGAGCAIQFLQAGLLHQAFGAYVSVLSDERGWSKTSLSGAAALQSAEAALLGPLLGWLVDRFGSRGLIRLGVAILGLGFMLLSTIQSLGTFYGAIIVIAIGSSLSGFFPVTVGVINWFERKRARALSTVGFGLALGGTCVPLVAWSIQTWGWRPTAFASGVLIIAAGLPLASLFKRRPEDVGQTLDGLPPPVPDAGKPTADGEAAARQGLTARQALRTSAFWLLAGGHGSALLIVTAVNVHAISHIHHGLGYTLAQAALAITFMTIAQIAGVGLGWLIGDVFEKRYLCAGCMLMHASGMLLLAHAQSPLHIAAFALLHGMAWGLRGPLMQAVRADYFGRLAIGKILGLSLIVVSIGQIAGPLVAGVLADRMGDYRPGFTVLASLALLGSLMFLAARPPAGMRPVPA